MEDEARDKKVEKYPHVNIYEPPEHIDLLEGIKSCSIYAAGQKLFKSHFHMSLGVVLSMKEDLIIQIDLPMKVLKAIDRIETCEVEREYYPELNQPEGRKFRLFKLEGKNYGLSESFQAFKVKSDKNLKTFGLFIEYLPLDIFIKTEIKAKIKCLTMKYEELQKTEVKSKILDLFKEESWNLHEILTDIIERMEQTM